MERNSFIFYRSYYDAISELPPEQQAEAYNAIIQYALFHKEPENLSPTAKMCLTFAKPNLDANYKRFMNGTKPKAARNTVADCKQTRSKQEAKPNQTASKPEADGSKAGANGSKPVANVDVNDDVDVDDNENVKDKESTREKPAHFVRPTLTEVSDYCNLEALAGKPKVDAEKFFNYYESNGWRVGKAPMRNWHAAVHTWQKNDFGNNNSTAKQEEVLPGYWESVYGKH